MFNIRAEKLIGSTVSMSGHTPMSASLSSSTTALASDYSAGVIEDFVQSEKIMADLYREIYTYDPVAGPAVDLLTTMPFSDFNLIGVSDPAVLRIFEDSLAELNVVELLQNITTSYLVLGQFIGSLLFNESQGIFTDVIAHNPDFCDIVDIPLKGYTPKIDLRVSPEMKKFLRSSDPRDREAQKEISPELRAKMMKGSKIALEPLSTLYVVRRSIPGVEKLSYYSRILPMWLIEKALIRGTIIGSWRRQRSILHLTCGSEEWEPSNAQLGELAQMFIAADQDPQGAVIATRNAIETNEVRSGSDFWKASDEWDLFANAKMRALGINDGFLCLSGDSYISTSKGLLQIRDICDKNGLKKDQYKKLDLTVKGYSNKVVKATRWYYRGKRSVLELNTRLGYSLKCTPDHKILTLSKNLTPIWKEAKKFKEDDYLFIDVSQKNLYSKKLKLNLTDPILNPKDHSSKKPDKVPKYMTPELAYILGLIVAEGGLGRLKTCIANANEGILKKYESCVQEVFGKIHISKYKYKNKIGETKEINGYECTNNLVCWDYEINSIYISHWLQEIGLIWNTHSYHKLIPKSIFKSDRASKLSFIAGFLDGDGVVEPRGIAFCSSSLKMLGQFRTLITDLGFLCYSMEDHPQGLILNGSTSTLLYEEIKGYLGHSYKKDIQTSYITPRRQGVPVDMIRDFLISRHIEREVNVGEWFRDDDDKPVLIERWGQIASPFLGSVVGKTKQENGVWLLRSSYKKNKYEELFFVLKKISPILYKNIKYIMDKAYVIEPLSYIKKCGKTDLYDLSIDRREVPAFVANNIVVHNSGDASYSTLEQALSVFVENIRTLRDNITNKVFYEKIFLLLAKFHKFKKLTQAELSHNVRTSGYTRLLGTKDSAESSKYMIPAIAWSKQLTPQSDREYVDMLTAAEEKGIPIPLRMIATASGVSMDKVIESFDEDVELRKKIAAYKEKLKKEVPTSGTEEEEGGEAWASVQSKINVEDPIEEIAKRVPDETILTGKQAGEIIKKSTPLTLISQGEK
jgi:intein/homing endonuclease